MSMCRSDESVGQQMIEASECAKDRIKSGFASMQLDGRGYEEKFVDLDL
ncbi:MAG: hypothetical protein H0U74_09480 [Bradymonadaceae bacterium]|nr:hypothetical protein [Lujinxingiaceae bacterium]